MRYLTLDANYQSSGIRDIDGNYLTKANLGSSEVLWDEIQNWVKAYNPIIMMDEEERKKNLSIIQQLDNQGLTICEKLIRELGSNIKIEYYSEGELKKIPVR